MLEDATVRSDSRSFDLHVYKDMLIVPRSDEKKVLFYQLNGYYVYSRSYVLLM